MLPRQAFLTTKKFYKPFEAIRKDKAKGGILIAVSTIFNEPLLIDKDSQNASYVHIQIDSDPYVTRIIVCYGPQENAGLEKKTEKF
jgi:hypothetical protein